MHRIAPSGQGLVLSKGGKSAKHKRKDPADNGARPYDTYGIARQALQRDLDERAVRDVLRMYWSTPSRSTSCPLLRGEFKNCHARGNCNLYKLCIFLLSFKGPEQPTRVTQPRRAA